MKRAYVIRLMQLLAIVCGILVIDQASKWLILEVVDLDTRRNVEITGFFSLVMVWNYGVSFGMLAAPGTWMPYLLKGLALVICVVLSVMAVRSADRAERIAYGLIVGGALGNVIDRVQYGAVVDFLYFHIGELGWPAFNVADSCIFLGVAYLIVRSIWPRRTAAK